MKECNEKCNLVTLAETVQLLTIWWQVVYMLNLRVLVVKLHIRGRN